MKVTLARGKWALDTRVGDKRVRKVLQATAEAEAVEEAAKFIKSGIRIKRWTEWDDSDRFEPVDSGLLGGHRVLLKVFVFHD